jgi:integrase
MTLKEARAAAEKARGGELPTLIKSACDAADFEAAARKWLGEREASDQRPVFHLERFAFPRWKGRGIGDITRTDIKQLLEAVPGDGPQRNRVKATIHTLFNWAFDEELIDRNPCAKIPRIKEYKRERVLRDDELARTWRAAGELGLYGRAIRMLILTGARKGEVVGMRSSELLLDQKLWKLPGRGLRTKTRQGAYGAAQ